MSQFLPTITEEQAKQQAKIFRALGEPVRIGIFNLLRTHGGQMTVADITANFHLQQASISHHLGVLKNAGLIDCHRHDLYSYYYVRAEAVAQAQGALREVAS